jgi:hypothetical protein
MEERMTRIVAGVWYGLIDGLAWLGRQLDAAGIAWSLICAVYGALVMWLVMR